VWRILLRGDRNLFGNIGGSGGGNRCEGHDWNFIDIVDDWLLLNRYRRFMSNSVGFRLRLLRIKVIPLIDR